MGFAALRCTRGEQVVLYALVADTSDDSGPVWIGVKAATHEGLRNLTAPRIYVDGSNSSFTYWGSSPVDGKNLTGPRSPEGACVGVTTVTAKEAGKGWKGYGQVGGPCKSASLLRSPSGLM